MGAEIALQTASPAQVWLNNFNNTIIAKMELEEGNWFVLGRVVLGNGDTDFQAGTAQLVRQCGD
jgi:hypothetical protein